MLAKEHRLHNVQSDSKHRLHIGHDAEEFMKKHTFTFMGTGAGCGVPAFFCECPACEEARRDPRARRGDCGVMVTGAQSGHRTLIDTPPDIRQYLLREGVRAIDDLLR